MPNNMITIFLATLSILVSFKLGTAQTINQAMLPIVKTCASLEEIDLQDLSRLAAASEDKVSENYKCFIKCEFEAIGILSMGKLDTSQLIYIEEDSVDIIQGCDKIVHHKGFDVEDDCDYGYKLGRCIADSLKEHLKQQASQRSAMKTSCASLTGFKLSELEQLKASGYQNPTQPFKCFQNCVFERTDILKNGRLNRAIFEDQHNENAFYNHVKECHVDIYEEGFNANATACEFAYQLLLCLEENKIADQEGAVYDEAEILARSLTG